MESLLILIGILRNFLRRVRFAGFSDAVHPDPDPENSDGGQDDKENGTGTKRKSRGSRVSLAPDSADSDSSIRVEAW